MDSFESSDKIKSFKELKDLLADKSVTLPEYSAPEIPAESKGKPDPGTEKQLFLDAMADVTPLPKPAAVPGAPPGKRPVMDETDPDAEAVEHLENLVQSGKGFVVSHTPEYIEGTGDRVHPAFTRRLHQGEFSIQAHIDLHGMDVVAAKSVFEDFLKHAIITGKRAVLIVHGRGLSSPSLPVLKTKVYQWLTSGPWRKWVIAFTSARAHDGGAGATYVLLRQRPLTKRQRKKK